MTERRPLVVITGVVQQLPIGDTLPGGGGGGGANVGTAILDFGAFPGSSYASVDVTGQTGIGSTSTVHAWLRPVDSADHLADEHLLEDIRILVSDIVAGVGFTIHGVDMSNDQLDTLPPSRHRGVGDKIMIDGQWNVNWSWQ